MQKVKNAELGLTDAKQKMRELALNIKMKEELIKELVRTGNWLPQGKLNTEAEGIKLLKSHMSYVFMLCKNAFNNLKIPDFQ